MVKPPIFGPKEHREMGPVSFRCIQHDSRVAWTSIRLRKAVAVK